MAVTLIEPVGPEILVGGPVTEQVVEGDEDRVADRHGGPPGTPSGGDPAVLGGEVRVEDARVVLIVCWLLASLRRWSVH